MKSTKRTFLQTTAEQLYHGCTNKIYVNFSNLKRIDSYYIEVRFNPGVKSRFDNLNLMNINGELICGSRYRRFSK